MDDSKTKPRSLATHCPLNVAALDEPGPGGACHVYGVRHPDGVNFKVEFQRGPFGAEGSTPGVLEDVLLAMIEDRLMSFQAGRFPSDGGAAALGAVREARAALAERVADRLKRDVLGKNEK